MPKCVGSGGVCNWTKLCVCDMESIQGFLKKVWAVIEVVLKLQIVGRTWRRKVLFFPRDLLLQLGYRVNRAVVWPCHSLSDMLMGESCFSIKELGGHAIVTELGWLKYRKKGLCHEASHSWCNKVFLLAVESASVVFIIIFLDAWAITS